MVRITEVISTSISEGFRRIKLLVRGTKDVRTAYESAPFGIDSVATVGLKAIHVQTGEVGKSVVVGYVNVNQLDSLVPGEHRMYSTDEDGNLSTFIYLRGDGTMEIGGSSDFMVRYSALETAFNALKSDFNGLVTKYNAHIHITTATVGATAVPGIIAPTTSSETPSTADISNAKIEEIKTI